MDSRIHGEAGISVVIEEFLDGKEASVFALCNGTDAVFFGSAQDYKKLYEPDGPNTGGMGAISPAPELNALVYEETWHSIILPTLTEMKRRGTPFKGILYAGIMIVDNMPKLIEYNVRFGDPECQAILMLLETDLLRLLYAAATGVQFPDIEFSDDVAITVVMAAPGYPQAPETGIALHEPSILKAHALNGKNNMVFHAGTRVEHNHLFTAGGRVLNVCAIGDDCRWNAYKVVKKINEFCFAETAVYRTDIGL
jgi:phosphoribosylamine--glycine ligase